MTFNKEKAIQISKTIAVLEGLAIIVLLLILFTPPHNQYEKDNLVSPRITSGLLKPENFLILNLKTLENELREYMKNNNVNASIYVQNMRSNTAFGIKENRASDAYSFNKLPVAMIILKKIERKEMTLDTLIPIANSQRDSGSGTLYLTKSKALSVNTLIKEMLQESDNTAFNVLSSQISIEDGTELANYLNFYENALSEEESHSELKITPEKTAHIFSSLYLSTYLPPDDSQLILQYLTNTSYDIKAYANLPENVTVSQKYGSHYYQESKEFYSCGIMYIDDSRMFYCIMTHNLERERAKETVGEMVEKIYKYIVEQKSQTMRA